MNSPDALQQIHLERPSGGNWNTEKRQETGNTAITLEGKEACTASLANDKSVGAQVLLHLTMSEIEMVIFRNKHGRKLSWNLF